MTVWVPKADFDASVRKCLYGRQQTAATCEGANSKSFVPFREMAERIEDGDFVIELRGDKLVANA
jgi:hypothetical protein